MAARDVRRLPADHLIPTIPTIPTVPPLADPTVPTIPPLADPAVPVADRQSAQIARSRPSQ